MSCSIGLKIPLLLFVNAIHLLLVRGLPSPITSANFFLTICDALHPQALLTQDPDFNLLLGVYAETHG
jgi:hypothetical protein